MKLALCLGAAVCIAAGSLSGAPVYGTALNLSDFNDSRSVANSELVGTGRFEDFTVTWEITESAGTFNYLYTFDFGNVTRQNSISHVILDLSDNCVDAPAVDTACVSIGVDEGKSFDPSDPGNSNPGLPASIVGAKFNFVDDQLELEFTSERRPMWGNIYGKAGSADFFYNTGLSSPLSEDVLDFVAVPDTLGSTTVPEPTSVVLIFGGIATLGFLRLRKRA